MIDDRDFERLMNQARVKLTGVSDNGLKGELYDTINEFVSDGCCWIEKIALSLVPNVRDYKVTPVHGGMVIRLNGIHDTNLVPLGATMADIDPPSAIIHIRFPVNINQSAWAWVQKKLTLPTTREMVPDAPRWLLPMYEQQILDGLLGRSMAEMNKPYTNQKQSDYHLKRFRDGIMIAKVAAMRANIFGGQSWRFPSQFRTTSQRGYMSTAFPYDGGF